MRRVTSPTFELINRNQTLLRDSVLRISNRVTTQTMNTENGIIVKESAFGFETTYQKLKEVIDNNPNLKIILELDHSKNASNVELDLPPTRLILFGNPKAGTPLMQSQRTIGLDLPQKALIYEENGVVKVAYNDPIHLQNRHSIEDKNQVFENIEQALNKITDSIVNKTTLG